MRIGLIISAIGHLLLLAWGVVSLQPLTPLDARQIEAVPVDGGWLVARSYPETDCSMPSNTTHLAVFRVTGKDVPMPYAANLEKLALPSVVEVVEAAKAVCYR